MTDPEEERLAKIKAGLKKPVRPAARPKPRVIPPKVGARPKVVKRPVVVPPLPKVIAEHTVVAGDTLSGIALKYYGSAEAKYYMYIYESNKAVVGDNPNIIRQGIVLKILEKPEL